MNKENGMAYDDNSAGVKRTPAIAIVVAWLVVGVPAAWGIYNTGLNAKKLFAPAPVAVSAPAATTHP